MKSIHRLGLDHIPNIDIRLSDEIYDSTNNNHIIFLYINKDISQ